MEAAPNNLQMLAVARGLRSEKDRAVQLRKQRAEEQNQKKVMQQKIGRTKERVSEAKQASIGATPQGTFRPSIHDVLAFRAYISNNLPSVKIGPKSLSGLIF